jgi:hypothetical protein
LILFLFVTTKKELPLTELESLGICAARRAREEVKKKMMKTTQSEPWSLAPTSIDKCARIPAQGRN